MAAKRYAVNNITLRVAPADAPTKYGESQLEVVVLPPVALRLRVSNANATKESAASPKAVALVDTLLLEVTPDTSAAASTMSLPQSVGVAYSFGGGAAVPLSLAATGNSSLFTAVAPLLGTANASETVSFVATLRWNDVVVSTSASATYVVANPVDMSSAATAQISEAQNIKDPAAAVTAVTNMAALMNSGKLSDEDKGALAAVAVNVLVNTVGSSAGSLTSDQQSQLLGTVSSSLATQSKDDTQRKVMSEKVAGIVTTMINSPTFDLTRANDTLSTLSKFDASAVGTAVSNLAVVMANDPTQPVGEPKSITSGNLTITTVKNTAANIGGTALSTGGASMSIPLGSGIASGADEDALIGIGSTFSKVSTQRSSKPPATGVASYDVTSNGKALKISNLAAAVKIGFGKVGGSNVVASVLHRDAATTSVEYVCQYFNDSTGQWASDGVTTVTAVDGSVTCATTHFTSFGVFPATTAPVGVVCPAASSASLASAPAGCGGTQRTACETAACSALGGAWSNSSQACVLGGTTPDEATARAAISGRLTCLVQVALNVSRGVAGGAATAECASWASSISLEYSDWYAARNTAGVNSTVLQQSCVAVACGALKVALTTTSFAAEYDSMCVFGNSSAAAALAVYYSSPVEMRVSGKNWASVLASNRSVLVAQLRSSIGAAVGLDSDSVVIDSLSIGSLVTVFRARSLVAAPSSSLVSASLRSSFSAASLMDVYKSAPLYDGTEGIALSAVSDVADIGSRSNAGAIAGGVVGGVCGAALVVVAAVVYLRKRSTVPLKTNIPKGTAEGRSDPYCTSTWSPCDERQGETARRTCHALPTVHAPPVNPIRLLGAEPIHVDGGYLLRQSVLVNNVAPREQATADNSDHLFDVVIVPQHDGQEAVIESSDDDLETFVIRPGVHVAPEQEDNHTSQRNARRSNPVGESIASSDDEEGDEIVVISVAGST